MRGPGARAGCHFNRGANACRSGGDARPAADARSITWCECRANGSVADAGCITYTRHRAGGSFAYAITQAYTHTYTHYHAYSVTQADADYAPRCDGPRGRCPLRFR